MNFKRYTLTDVSNNSFYQMPKFLFEGELKSSLSNDAKVLYSLLRDRHELSLKNHWINENNEVYLIYTRDEMCSMLGCSQPTLRKSIEQLKKAHLMDEERQGLNKPNLIYLNYYDLKTLENEGLKKTFTPDCKNLSVKNERAFQSKQEEIFIQECKDFSRNRTDINYTDFNHTDYHHQGDIEGLTKTIKKNISYDIAKETIGEQDYIDNILSIIIEVLLSSADTIRINKVAVPMTLVKQVFISLTYHHINYVCLCLNENTEQIKNIKAYLTTALYNAPQTMDSYYSQRVQREQGRI